MECGNVLYIPPAFLVSFGRLRDGKVEDVRSRKVMEPIEVRFNAWLRVSRRLFGSADCLAGNTMRMQEGSDPLYEAGPSVDFRYK